VRRAYNSTKRDFLKASHRRRDDRRVPMTSSAPAPAPRGNLASGVLGFLGGVFAVFALLPYVVQHAAPALTPSTLPPKPIHGAVMSTIGHLDALLTTLTPPNLLLFRHTMGYIHTVELYTAASLKIADVIHGGDKSGVRVSDLAPLVTPCKDAAPGTPSDCAAVALRLTRLLRACAAYGVFREGSGNRWSNTPVSEYLRADHPDSLRAIVLNFGGVQYQMMARMPEAIASGTSSFQHVFGEEFWAWHAKHPKEHNIFDATMAQLGRLGGADAAIANDVPWESIVDAIVDIGGGYGEMTSTIVRANKKLERGTILDIPHVIERTAKLWRKGRWEKIEPDAADLAQAPGGFHPAEDKALSERVSLVAGDMFNSSTIPSVIVKLEFAHNVKIQRPLGNPATRLEKCTHIAAPRHGYVLRDILHDWNDEDCVSILKSLRAVMRANETVCYGSDGSKVVRTALPQYAYRDRVLVVGRVIRPGASFIGSMGTNDADMVMLGAFGTTAGERTVEHFSSLFEAAGLELVAVHPTRSHYSILEARAKPTPAGWGYTGKNLRDPLTPAQWEAEVARRAAARAAAGQAAQEATEAAPAQEEEGGDSHSEL
jgi:hypothetical protein